MPPSVPAKCQGRGGFPLLFRAKRSPPGRPDSLTFHQQMMSARQLLANEQPESHRVEGLKHKASRCLYGDD